MTESDYLEPTALELLAFDAGVSPSDLREWLRDEIERRREATASSVAAGTSAAEAASSAWLAVVNPMSTGA
jgi:hypothetical protein